MQIVLTVATFLVLSLFACQADIQTFQEAVPTGVWGGKGIQLTVTEDGGSIDYGCDSGTIDERLQTDSHGKFSARGTHVFGQGGPRQKGDPAPKPLEARYEGVRNGDRLELTGRLPDLNRRLGKFVLRRGEAAVLERCG